MTMCLIIEADPQTATAADYSRVLTRLSRPLSAAFCYALLSREREREILSCQTYSKMDLRTGMDHYLLGMYGGDVRFVDNASGSTCMYRALVSNYLPPSLAVSHHHSAFTSQSL